jgi:hypothetical protein
MGLVPNHWGPYTWATIHLICLGAPDVLDAAAQQHYRAFFNMLPHVIPCSVCSDHLKENLKTLPIDDHLASNTDLFKWSVNLHNLVNKQLKKPQVSIEEAERKWREICNTKVSNGAIAIDNGKNEKPMWLFVIAAFVAGAAITYLFTGNGKLGGQGKGRRN